MDLVDLQKDLRRIPVVELETPTVVRTSSLLCYAMLCFISTRHLTSCTAFDSSYSLPAESQPSHLPLSLPLFIPFNHSLFLQEELLRVHL